MPWDDNIPADERQYYKVTRFSPDTCDCVLEYAWDTRSSEQSREHIPADIVNRCPAHSHHSPDSSAEHHQQVMEENRDKNQALLQVLESLDEEHCLVLVDADGNDFKWFKNPPAFRFSEDQEDTSKRNLVIELGDEIPGNHKADIATELDQHFPARKIFIE